MTNKITCDCCGKMVNCEDMTFSNLHCVAICKSCAAAMKKDTKQSDSIIVFTNVLRNLLLIPTLDNVLEVLRSSYRTLLLKDAKDTGVEYKCRCIKDANEWRTASITVKPPQKVLVLKEIFSKGGMKHIRSREFNDKGVCISDVNEAKSISSKGGAYKPNPYKPIADMYGSILENGDIVVFTSVDIGLTIGRYEMGNVYYLGPKAGLHKVHFTDITSIMRYTSTNTNAIINALNHIAKNRI